MMIKKTLLANRMTNAHLKYFYAPRSVSSEQYQAARVLASPQSCWLHPRTRFNPILQTRQIFTSTRHTLQSEKQEEEVQKFISPAYIPSPLETSEWFIDMTQKTRNDFQIDDELRKRVKTLMRDISNEELVNGSRIDTALVLVTLAPEQDLSGFAKQLFDYWGLSNHTVVIVMDKTRKTLGMFVCDEQKTRLGAPIPSVFTEQWFQQLQDTQVKPLLASGQYKEAIIASLESVLKQLKTQYSPISENLKEARRQYLLTTPRSKKTYMGHKLRLNLAIFAVLGAIGYLIYWYFFVTDTCPNCDRFSLKLQKDLQQHNYQSYPEIDRIKEEMTPNSLKELELGSCYFSHYRCKKCGFETLKRSINPLVPISHCYKCDTQAITTDFHQNSDNTRQIIRKCQFCGDTEVKTA